ncbi:MAG TPA: hypothetical protein VFK06_16545 [Candidatus Angelobacter sp.]|nr:hypothetical protein [Candidatus Angelobacter sp.]
MKSGPPRRLGSKNLILFRAGQHDYKFPWLEENNQDSAEDPDANLSPEEKSFIFHYLRYADALLKQPGEKEMPFPERRNNVLEMGREHGLPAQNSEDDDGTRFRAA